MRSATTNQTLEESKYNAPESHSSDLQNNLSSNLIPQIEYVQTQEQEEKPNEYFNADYVSEDEGDDNL